MTTEELTTVETPDGAELLIHPTSGEAVDLEVSTASELTGHLDDLEDLADKLAQFRAKLERELIRRVDRTAQRTTWIGPVKLQVNAATVDNYAVDDVKAQVAALREAGHVDAAAALEATIEQKPTPDPVTPPPAVSKTKINNLKKNGDPKLLAAIVAARKQTPTARTVKILEWSTDVDVVD